MKGLYLKNGKWYSQIQREGRRFKKCWGPVTKKVAEAKHGRLKAKVWSGEYQKELEEKRHQAKRVTLDQFTKPYLEYYEAQWRAKSFKRVRTSLKNLCAEFGGCYLDDICPLDIDRYKRKRKGEGASNATVNREMDALSNLYRMAVRDGKAKTTPLNGVTRLSEDNEKRWVLTDEEEDRLLAACDSIEENPPYLRNLVTVALYSGMRQGEVFDMREEHIDFKNEVLYVPNSKTHKARKVPVNKTLKGALRSALATSGAVSERIGEPIPWIFCNGKGEKIRNLKSGYWKAVASPGLIRRHEKKAERFRFHDLRHTFGTRLAQNGYDLKTIMEIMGHTTPKVALGYQHPTQDHKKAAVRSLDRKEKMAPGMVIDLKGAKEHQ